MINIVIFNGGRGAGTIIPALQSIENIITLLLMHMMMENLRVKLEGSLICLVHRH